MRSFRDYLTEAEVNSHMTHLSELVFTNGVNGTREAVKYLSDLRKMFGHSSKNTYTVKFDGAPAIFLGIDPTDGEFFVAKKGIFNKNPKIYKTQADIAADLSGELKDKFSIVLRYGAKLGITSGIYQGDLMYTASDLRMETIDDEKMVTFHPNTIVYAVAADSDLGKEILASRLGIVFHTSYIGDSFDTLKASFGERIVPKFKKAKDIWAIDASIDNATKQFNLSEKEWLKTGLLLSDIGLQFRNISASLLNGIAADENIRSFILIYLNSLVRANIRSLGPREMSEGFYKFIHDRFQKEIEAKKTPKGANAVIEKRNTALSFFDKFEHSQIATVFALAQDIESLKDILLSKMKNVAGFKHFLKTADGFEVTNPEGFVAIDSNSGSAVKLVDRFEFSTANFNSKFIKGWQR